MDAAYVLPVCFFFIALLYSSVGHAGASGYLAVMALLSFVPEQMRPTALCLNILVGAIGMVRFHRAQLIEWKKVWPFVIGSIPAAYFAGKYKIDPSLYGILLGSVLLIAAIALVRSAKNAAQFDQQPVRALNIPLAVFSGASIGVLAGLTGTGGAIFLTPLLLAMHWTQSREASGLSVAFVSLNSVSALIGLIHSGATLPSQLPLWLAAVAIGAVCGTQLGIFKLPVRGLRYALALVLMIAAAKLILH
jgi:uncharacterized protein